MEHLTFPTTLEANIWKFPHRLRLCKSLFAWEEKVCSWQGFHWNEWIQYDCCCSIYKIEFLENEWWSTHIALDPIWMFSLGVQHWATRKWMIHDCIYHMSLGTWLLATYYRYLVPNWITWKWMLYRCSLQISWATWLLVTFYRYMVNECWWWADIFYWLHG